MMVWSRTPSRRTETLVTKSLYRASKIHAFFLSSLALGFRIALHRSANIPSSLVGVVGVWRGSCMHHPRYSMCSLRGTLWRHPSTM